MTQGCHRDRYDDDAGMTPGMPHGCSARGHYNQCGRRDAEHHPLHYNHSAATGMQSTILSAVHAHEAPRGLRPRGGRCTTWPR
eukprot:3922129-Prymnesium_polylepis.2